MKLGAFSISLNVRDIKKTSNPTPHTVLGSKSRTFLTPLSDEKESVNNKYLRLKI